MRIKAKKSFRKKEEVTNLSIYNRSYLNSHSLDNSTEESKGIRSAACDLGPLETPHGPINETPKVFLSAVSSDNDGENVKFYL